MDSRNVEVQTRQKRVASSASATLGGLDFEIDTEILWIVGGHCLDRSLALRVEGSDSAHATVKDLKFDDLVEERRALYRGYGSGRVRRAPGPARGAAPRAFPPPMALRFEIVDHVGAVKDVPLPRVRPWSSWCGWGLRAVLRAVRGAGAFVHLLPRESGPSSGQKSSMIADSLLFRKISVTLIAPVAPLSSGRACVVPRDCR